MFDKWNWGVGDAFDGLDTLVYHGKQVNFMDVFFCPEVVLLNAPQYYESLLVLLKIITSIEAC